jgi:hypothetical protein
LISFIIERAGDEARDFTVRVQAAGFRPYGLKLQAGPDICFVRLGHELQRQTPESRAEAHLSIGELVSIPDFRDELFQTAGGYSSSVFGLETINVLQHPNPVCPMPAEAFRC